MKILVLSPHVPTPMAGASTRDYHIIEALASRHEVTLLTLNESAVEGVSPERPDVSQFVKEMRMFEASQVQSKRWAQLSSTLRGRSYLLERSVMPEMQIAIDEATKANRYDVVFCESVMLAGYRFPADTQIVIDQHNLEYEICWRTYQREKFGLRKFYSWLEARRLMPEELLRCRKANLVLVTSTRESVELQRLEPTCIIDVVPNGVDTTFFQSSGERQEIDARIIFTGSMDYYPNIDGALYFAQHCWPQIKAQVPQATWILVGKNPPPQILHLSELPGVTVTGSVPDVRPYLEEAQVAIAPLLIGSGTRLKILEAFAMRKPMVSTALGCEGLNVQDGRELVIADGPENFANAVVKLLRDAPGRQLLGACGRKLVEDEYSWIECGRRLVQALEMVCGNAVSL
jgi:sugar transferase (PEP-CTERM/EpsH1 system associated)